MWKLQVKSQRRSNVPAEFELFNYNICLLAFGKEDRVDDYLTGFCFLPDFAMIDILSSNFLFHHNKKVDFLRF